LQFANDIATTIFVEADANKDDQLSKQEITAYIQNKSVAGDSWESHEDDMKDVLESFDVCDTNNDGFISREELVDFLVKFQLSSDFENQFKELTTTDVTDKLGFATEIANTIFADADTNKDGQLSLDEIKAYIQTKCVAKDSWGSYEEDMKDVLASFDQCDTNNDNQISLYELITFLVKYQLNEPEVTDQMKSIIVDELSEEEKLQFATSMAETIFTECDTNEDNQLSKDEIIAYIKEKSVSDKSWESYEEDMKDVWSSFGECDTDKNGFASKDELINFFVKYQLTTDFESEFQQLVTSELSAKEKKAFAKSIVETIFKEGDTNDDEKLSKEEIKMYIAKKVTNTESSWESYEEDMKDVWEDFEKCDSDKDGLISRNELSAFFVKYQL